MVERLLFNGMRGKKTLRVEQRRNEIWDLLSKQDSKGESNWEKTGVINRSQVHVMSNGAGRALDTGNNQLANALIDSLTEGVARRNSDGRILIDRNSAAGQRLTTRFGAPRTDGVLTGSGGTQFQFVESGARNALGSGL